MVHFILSVSTKKLEIEVSDYGFQNIWTTEKAVSEANNRYKIESTMWKRMKNQSRE